MALPAFDATKHDVGINGVGYMLASGQKQDLRPGTTRASSGEGRFDSFESESFHAQSEFGGGQGQQRFAASDSFGSGIGDGRYGRYFAARKWLTAAGGGATSHYFSLGSTVYGIDDSAIDEIGTANTTARTSGTVYGKPAVSGNNYAFWVQDVSGAKQLFRWNGSGSPENVTPDGMTDAGAIQRYGRSMWAFGTRTQKAAPAIVQSVLNATTNDSVIEWTSAPTLGNVCFVILVAECPNTVTLNPTVNGNTTAYTKVEQSHPGVNAGAPRPYTAIFAKAADPDDTKVVVTYDAGVPDDFKMYLLEVEGLEIATFGSLPSADLELSSTVSSFTALGDSNVDLPEAEEWVLAVWNATDRNNVVTSYTQEANFTELVDESVTGATLALSIAHKTTSAVEDTSYTVTINTSGGRHIDDKPANVILAYQGSRFSTDTELFCLFYTNDDGITWGTVDAGTGTGIEVPGAALAAQGSLWFTTPSGLYKMSLATEGDESSAVVTGPYDEWQIPYNTDSVGNWMGQFEGLFYYNVGATLRQYAPGGIGRQLWPPADWATVAGEVTSVVGSEGGVYFGAGGYLWNYNGRGFQALAAQPASGALDSLHFAGGNLYCLGATARYIQFRYPSMRPDIWMTDGSNFDTGYIVTSELDFEKVNVLKVIRNFEIQGYFVGTSPGTISLDYMSGCAGNADPLAIGGGATTATWTNIGSLASTDGGVKTIQLATPVVCKRLYLRATITPSATGFPVLQAYTAYGRTMMPTDNRFALNLRLAKGMTDRQGGTMYATDDDVDAAVDALRALRQGTSVNYFNVVWVNPDGSTATFVCTPDEMSEPNAMFTNTDGVALQVSFVVSELP